MAETDAFKKLQRDFAADVFGVSHCETILNIPEGTSGAYSVKDEMDLSERFIYQTLRADGDIVASNHPTNLERHKHLFKAARGRVLISGLGLGAAVYEVLQRPEVTHVRVIEKSPHVIELVEPTLAKDFKNVEIIKGDIFSYRLKKGEYFDVIYHSIWNDKREVQPDDKAALLDRYKDFCDWQGVAFFSGKGGARAGTGRKKGVKIGEIKAGEAKRTVRKGVRFTPVEYRLLKKACEISGKTEAAIAQDGAIRESMRIVREAALQENILNDPELKKIVKGLG